MRKIFISLLSVVLLLSAVSCNKTPPEVPGNTDKDTEKSSVEEQLLNSDRYDVFEDEIYLCDDVYRSDDTPTHGTGSIALPMGQDVLEVKDYDILLCGDGCSPESVVSRASQGYAPAYRVVPDGEIDGNFKTLKFKMKVDEAWLNDTINSGINVAIEETLGSKYFYLLVLDEKHYAYIHLKVIDGVDSEVEHEAELADSIVKNARVTFEPKNEKLDLSIERVIRLAENKGEELTWRDFEMYSGRDIGSGLFILLYEIDDNFELRVGGVPTSSPMYIRLVSKANRENYIDIRTEDVEKFISENREQTSSSEMPDTNYSDITEIDSLPQNKENAILTGHTVGGFTQFYCFEPGMKYYRYDSGIEKYYECVLNLSAEFTDGEIIHFRPGAGSGEIEIFIKVLDRNNETVYLNYSFAAPEDPLNKEPSAICMYDKQEILDSGINTELLCGYPTALYFKVSDYLEEEFHRVFDPYYDIQSLTISNWQENGNEATFFYKMTHKYYNTDPDTVDYIKKAKENGSENYEKLYNDYLAEKEANFEFKAVLVDDNIELYSNVSPKGVEWQPVKIDDYILGSN